jgi:tyrosyl-tRNA synthetase
MNIYDELAWRGLIHQTTSEELRKLLAEQKVTLYVGFDPTASSLHAGSLVPLLSLQRFRNAGHQVIILLGGATGLIGDPSGKAQERTLETPETVRQRAAAMQRQIERFCARFDGPPPIYVNNLDWAGGWKLLEFLRDIGKHFAVNEMIKKDSVLRRLEGEQAGISFTEFSYSLIQAADFLELFRRHGCGLQCGASDQWGNIVAGIELTRRVAGQEVYGLTFPLLLDSEGKKVGKTEKGAVWLDPEQCSPYEFYQFWVNTADADVVRFLKWFTFLDEPTINDVAGKVGTGARVAQKALAFEVTALVHGRDEAEKVRADSSKLFARDLSQLPLAELKQMANDVPSITMTRGELGGGIGLLDLLVKVGACTSKSDARRQVQQNGIKLSGVPVTDEKRIVTADDFKGGEVLLLQKGKQHKFIVVLAG